VRAAEASGYPVNSFLGRSPFFIRSEQTNLATTAVSAICMICKSVNRILQLARRINSLDGWPSGGTVLAVGFSDLFSPGN
jgi:hypothetical protein